ncbi:hypothetical protein evm_006937 [Chilo suppressalis]|nr:hypothetical protein evm_006937 [Chilo suppressalis]
MERAMLGVSLRDKIRNPEIRRRTDSVLPESLAGVCTYRVFVKKFRKPAITNCTMDDPFVSCPYEAAHRVPRSRLQAHIVKCQKNHPQLQICPYNATHRLPEAEMKVHLGSCPSKAFIFSEIELNKVRAALTTPKPILQKEYLPETDPNHESWDD